MYGFQDFHQFVRPNDFSKFVDIASAKIDFDVAVLEEEHHIDRVVL